MHGLQLDLGGVAIWAIMEGEGGDVCTVHGEVGRGGESVELATGFLLGRRRGLWVGTVSPGSTGIVRR